MWCIIFCMECKICQKQAQLVKTNVVMGKYKAEYFLCTFCGFMFIGNPFWLEEAYKESINDSDTGYVLRNVYLSRKTLVLCAFLFDTKAKFLDYAGGYGMLARLMRDYGLEFFTYDLHTPNLFMKGFEYKDQRIEALTCFECFEHFDSPIDEIEKMLKISKNIFFSTLLMPEEIPNDDWQYYGLHHGQHISFYSLKTLEYIAKKHGIHLVSDGLNLHMFTKNKISSILFNFLLKLTTFQVDVIIRKLLTSKTTSDVEIVMNKMKS